LFAAVSIHSFSDFALSIYELNEITKRGTATITAGLPFKKGEVTSLDKLTVFDASGQYELFSQLTPLVQYEDGSFQWILADFQATLNKGDTTHFWVKNSTRTAAHATPITVDSTSADYTINTGVIKFRIKRSSFNGIDALWHGAAQLIGGSGGGIKINDGSDRWGTQVDNIFFEYLGQIRATLRIDGTFFTAAAGGLTFRVRIHAYAGSDELKIETSIRNCSNPNTGDYHKVTSGGELILPFASPFSSAARKAPKDTLVQNFQTAYSWYENATHGLLAAARFGGGFTPELQFNRLTLSGGKLSINIQRFSADMPDQSTMDKVVFLKFYTGALNSTDAAEIVRVWRHPAIALADCERISAAGGLGVGKLGDIDNEVQIHRDHGADPTIVNMFHNDWGTGQTNVLPTPEDGTFSPTDVISVDVPVQYNASGNYKSYSNDCHHDMETDNLEGFLITWVRCGNPLLYKHVRAWSNYFKTFHALRSDGFENDAQYNFDIISQDATRNPRTYEPDVTSAIKLGRCDDIAQGGAGCCHIFGWGLGDHYVLTGDVESREALIDLAETAWANDRLGKGRGGDRGFARRWKLVMRTYQITRQAKWRNRIDEYEKQQAAKALDPRNFNVSSRIARSELRADRLYNHSGSIPYMANDFATILNDQDGTHLANGWMNNTLWTQNMKGDSLQAWYCSVIQTWDQSFMADAAYRSYMITGNEYLRDFVLGKAQFMMKYGINSICKRNFYGVTLDFPFPDSIRGKTFAFCDENVHRYLCDTLGFLTDATYCDAISGQCGVKAGHSGYEDFHWVNTLCDAYDFTGNREFLDWAWQCWSNGLRTNWSAEKYICDTTRLGRYSNCTNRTWNRASPVVRLFYTHFHQKQDQIPPTAVTDLHISKTSNPGEWLLTWTTPANIEPGGEIQIKFDTLPIHQYNDWNFTEHVKPAYNYLDSWGDNYHYYLDTTWWMAANTGNEPAPVPGTYQMHTINTGKTDIYFALRTRDAAGNLSPISNLVHGDPATPVQTSLTGAIGQLVLNACPNPFNPVSSILFNIPVTGKAGTNTRLDIYDSKGRLVRALVKTNKKPGHHRILWNGKNDLNRPAGSGIYLLRLIVGNKSLTRKIVLAK
jgi:hypothetical protein